MDYHSPSYFPIHRMENLPSKRREAFFEKIFLCRRPKKFIQCFVQTQADCNAQADCGIVGSLFNGIDCLPGNSHQICQLLLVWPQTYTYGSAGMGLYFPIRSIYNAVNPHTGGDHHRNEFSKS